MQRDHVLVGMGEPVVVGGATLGTRADFEEAALTLNRLPVAAPERTC